MSLNKFKTDLKAAQDGIEFKYPANADGSIPSVRLARMSKHNKAYTKAVNKATKNMVDENGDFDTGSMSEQEADSTLLAIFADTVLVGWDNIQPEDDGVALEFNRENVIALLSQPEWVDLYDDFNAKAKRSQNYSAKKLRAAAKN